MDATIEQWLNWINHDVNIVGSNKKRKTNKGQCLLDSFDSNEYWAYADYKYMMNLVSSNKNSIGEDVKLQLF